MLDGARIGGPPSPFEPSLEAIFKVFEAVRESARWMGERRSAPYHQGVKKNHCSPIPQTTAGLNHIVVIKSASDGITERRDTSQPWEDLILIHFGRKGGLVEDQCSGTDRGQHFDEGSSFSYAAMGLVCAVCGTLQTRY